MVPNSVKHWWQLSTLPSDTGLATIHDVQAGVCLFFLHLKPLTVKLTMLLKLERVLYI